MSVASFHPRPGSHLCRFFFLSLVGIALSCEAAPATNTVVIYPGPESDKDLRHDELIELVDGALSRTTSEFGPYTLEPSKLTMNEARALLELKRGKLINIAWSSTSVEKERDLLPIRIPLRKGILGYRLALINRARQPVFDQVRTVNDLKNLVVCQGVGWGDLQVYETNGIKTVSAEYESLFAMVAAGHADLFPRGLNEIFAEYDIRGRQIPELAIEKSFVVYYPWPDYCFFNNDDKLLADRIEKGLRKMIKDGTFNALFRKWNGPWITAAKLNSRRVIRLDNPLLPKETPLRDRALWFDPKLGQ